MTRKRERRTFSEEFKNQIVQLYNAGKPRSEIIREYELCGNTFDKWVKRINATGSTRECDNRTPEQNELIQRCVNVLALRAALIITKLKEGQKMRPWKTR